MPIPITVKPGNKEGNVSMSQVHAGRRAHHFGRLGCFYSCFLDHEYRAGGKDLDLLAARAPREPRRGDEGGERVKKEIC